MKSILKGFFIRHFAATLIGILIVATLFITGGMISSIKANIDDFGIITPSGSAADNEAVIASVGEQYIIREYEGRIGIFAPGESVPERVIQIYVTYLPEKDRAILRDGFCVSGKKALEEVLEDLGS